MEIDKIREHMEVVGSDGKHVGTVDHLDGEGRIKLTRNDPAANNEHHFLQTADVDSVDDVVRLRISASQAQSSWAKI